MQTHLNRPLLISPLHARPSRNPLQKRRSQSKQKRPSRSSRSNLNLKKRSNRKKKEVKDELFFADLFSSARGVIVKKKGLPVKAAKGREKKAAQASSGNKFEESTASREFKLKSIHYDNPNGEYFGSKISIKERRSGRSKKKERDKGVLELTKSLELKIRHLRRMESVHTSQSESLKSDVSEKELRRLEKMQSLERVHLMEEIVGIGEKMVGKGKRRS